MVLLLDAHIVLTTGPQPRLRNQHGEAEGSAGFGRGEYRSFASLLNNCKCPVDHCSNSQVLQVPAGNIYNCKCYIFNPGLNSESALWKLCRGMDDCISEEAAGVVYRDVRRFIFIMSVGLLTEA